MLRRDVIAGVTLAALAIPEVMGYTKIVGTPVITGLYTILIPAVVFAVVGSSRHLVVGGDSATAAMLFAGLAGLGISGLQPSTSEWVTYTSWAALVTGGLLVVARLARLGFLADFISRTVLVGFLTGVGIQVAMGQLSDMLGVAPPSVGSGRFGRTLTTFWDAVLDIGQASLSTGAVSAAVLATLAVFRRWVHSIPGGLVAVVGSIAVSVAFDLQSHGVATVGPVASGFPAVGVPSWIGWQSLVALVPICVGMFLVVIAQSAATSRAYAVKHRDDLDENEDIFGLALSNISAGLSGTFPVNGSPTKTEMGDDAGARTQVAMLAMAATVGIVLMFLTQWLQYLPQAALATVVFVVGVRLVDVHQMRRILAVRREEFGIAAITAAVVVCVGVEQAILLAVVLSLLDHVRRHYRVRSAVVVEGVAGRRTEVSAEPGIETVPGLVAMRFSVGIFYANATRFAETALQLVDVARPPRWLVLVADRIDDVDFTGGETLRELARQVADRHVELAIAAASDHVAHELALFGVVDAIGAERVFPSLDDAIAAFEASEA